MMINSKMNRNIMFLTAALFFFSFNAEALTTRVSGFVGIKYMEDDGAWNPYEEQLELGGVIDIKPDYWPVSIVTGIYWSADARDEQAANQSYTENNGTTTEMLLGLRRTWAFNGTNLRPFYVAGLAYISGEKEELGKTQKDSMLGYWLGTGISWTFIQRFDVGVEARYSKAEADFSGTDVELGGTHLGVTLGYSW